MRKHIFTLGLILASIYTVPAVADEWSTQATKTSDDVCTDSQRNQNAIMHCSDCCAQTCWLPSGTYYDKKGSFVETCDNNTLKDPGCEEGATYALSPGGICEKVIPPSSSCSSDASEVKFCVSGRQGVSYGYYEFDGNKSNTGTYGLTTPGTWGVTFGIGKVTGVASCNTTQSSGQSGTAVNSSFSNDVTGGVCWCKVTSQGDTPWVYVDSHDTTEDCKTQCAFDCATDVKAQLSFYLQGDKCPSDYYTLSVCANPKTDGADYGCHSHDGEDTTNIDKYNLSTPGEWATEFSQGVMWGMSACSDFSGSFGSIDVDVDNEYGHNCWCKLTFPNESDWIFVYEGNDEDECARNCADACGDYLRSNTDFRTIMFDTMW